MNNQIKSKERVTEHGEVYTSEREVNNMLDLVNKKQGDWILVFLNQRVVMETFLLKY